MVFVNLVDGEGNQLVNLADLEPWVHSVVGTDYRIHPVLRITYKAHSVEIEWSKDDKETILKQWGIEDQQ